MSEIVLEAEDLVIGYGEMTIVHGLSIRARAAEITAIVGPNGSGKSTLLKGLCGLLRPKSGRLRLRGADATNQSLDQLVRHGIGYVPQLRNVFQAMTVRENLEVGGATCRAQTRERMALVYELFPDLAAASGRPARTLSGGQRNMLALGRALMTDPKVLVVDEPTAGLSPVYSGIVWQHLQEVCKREVGVVIVEQNTHRALKNAAQAYLLVNGRLALHGTGQQLLDDPRLMDIFMGRQAAQAI